MMRQMVPGLALFAALVPMATSAQSSRPALDYAAAATMRDACVGWASERKLKMAIAIVDDTGRLVTFAHMDGTLHGSNQLAREKAQSAASFRIATARLAERSTVYVPGVIAAGGGQHFLTADGQPLGGIGISGGTVPEDIECGKVAIGAAGLRVAE